MPPLPHLFILVLSPSSLQSGWRVSAQNHNFQFPSTCTVWPVENLQQFAFCSIVKRLEYRQFRSDWSCFNFPHWICFFFFRFYQKLQMVHLMVEVQYMTTLLPACLKQLYLIICLFFRWLNLIHNKCELSCFRLLEFFWTFYHADMTSDADREL